MSVLELPATAEVDTIWFVGDGTKDWMAAVLRLSPTDPWELRYRFRYYKTADPWDGQDEKHAYRATGRPRDLVDAAHMVSGAVLRRWGSTAQRWVLPIHGGQEATMAILKQQPWAHMKKAPLDADPAEDAKVDGKI